LKIRVVLQGNQTFLLHIPMLWVYAKETQHTLHI